MQFIQFQLADFATGAAIPLGKCAVTLAGTSTPAALYNASGGAISNPAVASSLAQVGFAAADGLYDFQPQYADGTNAGPKILGQQLVDLVNFAAVGIATRSALAAIASPAAGTVRFLTEAGRQGPFVWTTGDQSGNVTNDPQQGIYVPLASNTSGTSGAWVRQHRGTVTPFMFGAVDCTGSAKQVGEVVYDCSNALDAMWGLVLYMQGTLNIKITMDLSDCLGLGVTRTWTLSTNVGSAIWNSMVFDIIPGRLVAMAKIDAVVELYGRNFQVSGQWELYGGRRSELTGTSSYGDIWAKHGMIIRDAGGSNLGDFLCQGFRRFAIKFVEGSDSNNIPVTMGSVKAIQCGDQRAGSKRFNGSYTSGAWTNQPTMNNDFGQKHRMTLTPNTGVDPTDIEVGDPIFFNGTDLGFVQTVVSTTSTTAVVDIYPYQATQATGTFQSYHGGAIDCRGGNLANTSLGVVEAFVCGTGVRYSSLYCPTIRSLLCESTYLCVQMGFGGQLESMEGINVLHYHFENVIFTIVDAAASVTGAYFGTASNLEGNNRGKWDKCIRAQPNQVLSGTFYRGARFTMRGVTFQWDGGILSRGNSINIETDIGGGGIAIIGNSKFYDFGPINSNAFTFRLNCDRSLVEKMGLKTVPWGPVYGTGTNGAPTGNIVFQVQTDDSTQTGITVGGGSSKTLTSTDGGLMGVAVYEPPVTSGDNGDWKIFSWKVTRA